MSKLRLVAIQLDSKLKAFSSNIAQAERLFDQVSSCDPAIPTVVVLPELALTGYSFQSQADIGPYLEPENGPSTKWASMMAKKHNCHVLIGYPERDLVGNIYNSASLVGPNGTYLKNYRKSQLYHVDRQWGAKKSPTGFEAFSVPQIPATLQVGICMDLNPDEFQAPFNALEFARNVAANKSQIVLCPMAWADERPSSVSTTISSLRNMFKTGPILNSNSVLLNYWRARLPLGVPAVFANRTGEEGDIYYGGTSTIWDGKQTWSLDRQEGVLERVVTIPSKSDISLWAIE